MFGPLGIAIAVINQSIY